MSRSRTALFCLLGVYLLWGSTFMGIRLAVQTIPPFVVGSIRHGFGGGLLLVTLLLAGFRWDAFGSPRQILNAVKVGWLTAGISNGALIWAGVKVPSGISAITFTTMPLFLGLFNWCFFQKIRPAWLDWVAIGLGVIGSALVALKGHALDSGSLGWFEAVLMLVSPTFWAWGSLVGRQIRLPPHILASAAWQMLGGASLMVLVAVFHGDFLAFDFAHVSSTSWGGLAYLSIGGSLVGYTLFATAIRSLDPRLVGTYAFMNPVVALALGLLWGERLLTPPIVTGSVLALLGVALSLWSAWQRSKATSA